MTDEARLRDEICLWGRSMFERGLTSGASGNLSARLPDGVLLTPTNACLGFLDPARLSRLDAAGRHVAGDPPTKEVPLHLAVYQARPQAGGIVHLHSTHATALSCLADVSPTDAIPPITPYVAMRVGRVPVLPYTAPGSAEAAPLIEAAAHDHAALLLANHGPVVSASSFRAAVFAAEELEETARLLLLTRGMTLRAIPEGEVAALARYLAQP